MSGNVNDEDFEELFSLRNVWTFSVLGGRY